MNVKYEGISCQWHCPNCGALVQGIKNGDGVAKGECRSCGSSMVRKFMGRRHDRLDVYAPKGQESVYAYYDADLDDAAISNMRIVVITRSAAAASAARPAHLESGRIT